MCGRSPLLLLSRPPPGDGAVQACGWPAGPACSAGWTSCCWRRRVRHRLRRAGACPVGRDAEPLAQAQGRQVLGHGRGVPDGEGGLLTVHRLQPPSPPPGSGIVRLACWRIRPLSPGPRSLRPVTAPQLAHRPVHPAGSLCCATPTCSRGHRHGHRPRPGAAAGPGPASAHRTTGPRPAQAAGRRPARGPGPDRGHPHWAHPGGRRPARRRTAPEAHQPQRSRDPRRRRHPAPPRGHWRIQQQRRAAPGRATQRNLHADHHRQPHRRLVPQRRHHPRRQHRHGLPDHRYGQQRHQPGHPPHSMHPHVQGRHRRPGLPADPRLRGPEALGCRTGPVPGRRNGLRQRRIQQRHRPELVL